MSTITLCFDFGNTRLKCGVFIADRLEEVIILMDYAISSIQKILEKYPAQDSIISSVIAHDPAIEKLLKEQTNLIILTASTPLPFTIPVTRPETMGADRIALAAFATLFYKKQNTLVIALGTCITYNFINKYDIQSYGSKESTSNSFG